ncbi:MAG: winged helix-turn-helix transcriptional regulator [Thermoplasmata archaeon]
MREKILTYINSHQGVHYRMIKNGLKLGNGTLSYHLHTLEKEGKVRSKKFGRYRVFYIQDAEKPYLTPLQRKILEILKNKPSISLKNLSGEIGISRQLLSYHLKILEMFGLVKKTRRGKEVYISLPEK